MLKNRRPGARSSGATRTLALIAIVLLLPVAARAQSERAENQAGHSSRAPRAQASQSSDPNQVMAAARAALKRQDYGGAIADLKPLAKAYPGVSAIWFELAYAHTGLHQNEAAVSAYEKAIKIDPKLYPARMNLGILFMVMNRPADALPQLKEAAALKPGDARAHLYLGRAEALTGAAGAEEDLQAAARLNASSSEAWLNLAQFDFKKENFAAARDAFEKALALDPNLEAAKLGAAASLEKLKQYKQAAPYLEQYLKAKPSDQRTRFNLAGVEMNSGSYPEALANLQEIEKQDPSFPGLDGALGAVCAQLKQFPASEKYYRLALSKNPAAPGVHRALGNTLMGEKNYNGAEAEFRAALKLDPGSLPAANGLAASLYFQKRYADAIPVLLGVIQKPPASRENYFLLAASYDRLHDDRPAIEAYRQFLSLSQGKGQDQEWQAQQRIKLLEHELER